MKWFRRFLLFISSENHNDIFYWKLWWWWTNTYCIMWDAEPNTKRMSKKRTEKGGRRKMKYFSIFLSWPKIHFNQDYAAPRPFLALTVSMPIPPLHSFSRWLSIFLFLSVSLSQFLVFFFCSASAFPMTGLLELARTGHLINIFTNALSMIMIDGRPPRINSYIDIQSYVYMNI